jgi:hypothetical protein
MPYQIPRAIGNRARHFSQRSADLPMEARRGDFGHDSCCGEGTPLPGDNMSCRTAALKIEGKLLTRHAEEARRPDCGRNRRWSIMRDGVESSLDNTLVPRRIVKDGDGLQNPISLTAKTSVHVRTSASYFIPCHFIRHLVNRSPFDLAIPNYCLEIREHAESLNYELIEAARTTPRDHCCLKWSLSRAAAVTRRYNDRLRRWWKCVQEHERVGYQIDWLVY